MMSEFGKDPNADMMDGTRGLSRFVQRTHCCHVGASALHSYHNLLYAGALLCISSAYHLLVQHGAQRARTQGQEDHADVMTMLI